MCGAFSGFFLPIYSRHYVDLLKKNAFLLIRMPFWSSYVFVSGETLIMVNLRSS